jgi:circadian clock protein KaiB
MDDSFEIIRATDAFEKGLESAADTNYVLRLFVSGMTPCSLRAIQNISDICQEYLDGRYELEVVDIYQHPEKGKAEQVIAAPTLIKKLPMPICKFIGDLSEKEKILIGLNLVPKEQGGGQR